MASCHGIEWLLDDEMKSCVSPSLVGILAQDLLREANARRDAVDPAIPLVCLNLVSPGACKLHTKGGSSALHTEWPGWQL